MSKKKEENKTLLPKTVELSDDKEKGKDKDNKDKGKSAHADEALYGSNEETHAVLWGRTFFIGIIYFIITFGVMLGCLVYSAWLALGLFLVVVAIFTYTSSLWSCCFAKRTKRDWDTPLGRVIMISALLACVAGIAGGYYLREWYMSYSKVTHTNVKTTTAPLLDFGAGTFGKNGVTAPSASVAMLTEGYFGVVLTCLAPIIEDDDQKTVSYVAVSQGKCCSTKPISCDGWNSTKTGGIVLAYPEFYPKTKAGLDTLADKYNLVVDPDVLFIKWGHPVDTWKEDIKYSIMIVSICAGLSILSTLYIAVKG